MSAYYHHGVSLRGCLCEYKDLRVDPPRRETFEVTEYTRLGSNGVIRVEDVEKEIE